ncbi:hypothetical protein GCM10011611_40360 [Aliidongia dinghuensis]|uniref:Uncharacterized protein n=1 Tax=Aliidongia dinghuensis TaxID=1867774 RepID=A0A8J3E6J1_9PROT|nr:hypothetical protein [Aliidongia dinghuensis]GGF30189.1 hypothetical protein GCM10011611_40360 [Aliidongia dinghuensis]
MMIRIEPVLDETSARYFLEIYNPADATEPFITTVPRYASPAAAEQDVLAILAAAASTAGTETH